jgi:hypothetical protein
MRIKMKYEKIYSPACYSSLSHSLSLRLINFPIELARQLLRLPNSCFSGVRPSIIATTWVYMRVASCKIYFHSSTPRKLYTAGKQLESL